MSLDHIPGAAPRSSRPRMSAEDRRAAIIRAAVSEFAGKGFEGTSTDAIARRAGVSQPYVFQLFGTKRDLFVATLRQAFVQTREAFEAAAWAVPVAERSAETVLCAMGDAYCGDLLRDRELLQCQLHAYAACGDPDIRAAVRTEFATLYRTVAELSGADAPTLDQWFAWGMLMNTVVALAPEMAGDGGNLTLAGLGALPQPGAGSDQVQVPDASLPVKAP